MLYMNKDLGPQDFSKTSTYLPGLSCGQGKLGELDPAGKSPKIIKNYLSAYRLTGSNKSMA